MKLNISSIFGESSVINHVRHNSFHIVNNGHISGTKNNYLWQNVKRVFKNGYLIVLLGLDEDKLSSLNSKLSQLTKCLDEEICKSNQRCLKKSNISDECRTVVFYDSHTLTFSFNDNFEFV